MAIDPLVKAQLDIIDTSTAAARVSLAGAADAAVRLRALLEGVVPPPPTDTPISILHPLKGDVPPTVTRVDSTHVVVPFALAGTLSRVTKLAVAVVGGTWQEFQAPASLSGNLTLVVPGTAGGTFHFHVWDTKAPLVSGWQGPISGDVPFPAANVPPPPPPPPTTGQFNVAADGQITDPDGHPFVANGTNCTGGDSYGWGAEYDPTGKSALWQGWGLNCIRHVHYAHVSAGNHPSTVHYGTTDALIDEYTARKMVVILDNHEGQLGDPNGKDQAAIDAAIAFFVPLATKYKGNPYVWFELFNEPQQENYQGPPPHNWVDYHAAVAAAIRATGNDNMILCCPSQFGQDAGSDTSTPSQSVVLTYGQELVTRFGPRLGFSPHIYSRWSNVNNIAGDQSLVNRFAAYRAKGFAIVVTETGAYAGGIPGDADAAHRLFRIAPNVGVTPWMTGTLAPPGTDVWPEFWGWAATH